MSGINSARWFERMVVARTLKGSGTWNSGKDAQIVFKKVVCERYFLIQCIWVEAPGARLFFLPGEISSPHPMWHWAAFLLMILELMSLSWPQFANIIFLGIPEVVRNYLTPKHRECLCLIKRLGRACISFLSWLQVWGMSDLLIIQSALWAHLVSEDRLLV